MKFFYKCPLLICLAASAIVLTAVSYANADGIYRDYSGKIKGKPALASIFMGAKDGVFFWQEQMEPAFAVLDDTNGIEQEENIPDAEQLQKEQEDTGFADKEAIQTSEEAVHTDQGEALAENTGNTEQKYDFVNVEDDYFDNALFIGDSRTQGLLEYGNLEERAAFYCRTSLTIYDLFEKEKAFIEIGDETLTLEQALEKEQFQKIYLMLGINELGTGTPESFLASYTAAVEKIRQLQPGAIIFVQAIMKVTGEKSAADPVFNNPNISVRNELIKTLADEKDIFYMDVNEAVCDENGDLYEEWTFDQIHLKAKYYEVWRNFLKAHGIQKKVF